MLKEGIIFYISAKCFRAATFSLRLAQCSGWCISEVDLCTHNKCRREVEEEEKRWEVGSGDFVGSPHPQEMHWSQEISGFGWSSQDLDERTLWNFVSSTLHS